MADADSVMEGPWCSICREDVSESADILLYHVMKEHFDSEEFQSFVEQVRVLVTCNSCGVSFESELTASPSFVFTARSYCPSCTDGHPLRVLVAEKYSCRDLADEGYIPDGEDP